MKILNSIKVSVLVGLFCLQFNPTEAQNILLDETPGSDTSESNFGKNKKHYMSGYVGGGWFVSPVSGNATNPLASPYTWRSGESFAGVLYKRKWSEHLSTVLFLENISRIAGKQRQQDTLRYDYTVNSLSMGMNKRLNFKKRGNHYGLYLEFGAQAEWIYGESLLMVNRSDNSEFSYRKKRTRIRGLNNTNPFTYDLNARFGYNGFCIYGRYRLQPVFKESSGFDLPVITTGVIWDLSF